MIFLVNNFGINLKKQSIICTKKRKKGLRRMKQTDVLIIGGSAAGFVASITAKTHYPEKNVLLIRKEQKAVVPCGIPYIFGSLENSNQNLMPDENLEKAGVEVLVDEIISCDLNNKTCIAKSGETIQYEKLVFATGSIPKIPSWLSGTTMKHVFSVPKDKAYLDIFHEALQGIHKVVVVGGGFIGVEMSDELKKAGKDVTIIEVLPHVLNAVFDEKTAQKAEQALMNRGVKVKAGIGIKEITGTDTVNGITLENGEKIEADAVILAMGYVPNTELARKSGIKINDLGQIDVDEYMRTDNYDVFAIGDCAQKRDFFTRRITPGMLASTACAEARIVGMNLYGLTTTKNFKGTLSIFSTSIGEDSFGVAGLTSSQAKKQNLPVIETSFEAPDKHPGKLPGMHLQSVELVVAKESGQVLGGTIIGGQSTGELVNFIGLAIQNNMTVYDILTTQIGTHPLLTAPPTAYPIIKAAEVAVKKLKKSGI